MNTAKTKIIAMFALLTLTSCSNPNNKPVYRPVCFTEGDLQQIYFYKCLNAIPEERRTANDLKACDDASIVQASTQCVSMGMEP